MRSLALLDQMGSIHDVAAQVHLTPAAVHRQLKTLEREFGVPLYVKAQGRLKLTEAGRILLPFVREVLTQHDAARTVMLDWNKAFRGYVRVGAGPSFSTYILPTLLKRFRKRCPGIEVFIESGASGHILDRLYDGELDLAFDIAPSALDDPLFEQVVFWRSQVAFIAATGLVDSPCTIAGLQAHPFILFQKGSRMEQIVQSYMDQLNFRPKVVMRADSSEAIKAMIRARLGVSILFAWNVNADLRSRTLSLVRTEAKPLNVGMALIRVRSSHTSPGMREFVAVAKTMAWPNLHLDRETDGP